MIFNKGDRYKRGNRVCRSMRKSVLANESPLDSKQIQKIKAIYNDCRRFDEEEFPLIYASREGYFHIAWGFVECAKQTNTNLHTSATGEVEVQNFLWCHNRSSDTALHVAVKQNHFFVRMLMLRKAQNHVDVAMLLLENASMERLMSERDQNGKSPISMLGNNPTDDRSIISILEKAKRENMDSQTSVQIVDIQETKVYSSSIMDVDSYPKSHKSETRKSLEKLNNGILEVTPSNNTILHLVSKIGDIKYVKDIIKEHHSLLYIRNSEAETPAYIAAREGHMDILETMIHYFKMKNEDEDIELLVKRTIDNNTALHVAVQNHHVGVVFLLIKQIPKLANHINNLNESPIYLAAERSYAHILKLMMDNCVEKTFEGPNGKTSLHAAAISNSKDTIKYLLSENRDLLYKPDNHHQTPLHYAVHHNNLQATKMLLNTDTSLGYKKVMEDGIESSLVHIASSRDHRWLLEFLISKCPGCSEITDGKGRNILHVAIDNKSTVVIKYIFQDESIKFLINQKDDDGNTPIRLYMASKLDMIEEVMDPRVDINILNNEGYTPLDVASSRERRNKLLDAVKMGIPVRERSEDHKRSREELDKELEATYKHVNQLLVVVTLIATATFAAIFTVPGGFDGNEGSKQAGMPILLNKAAFQVFMVTNTLAFSCSCAALFGFSMLSYHNYHGGHIKLVTDKTFWSTYKFVLRVATRISVLTFLAILAMSVAFATGIYVVLTPYPGLAISLCFITLCINFYILYFAVGKYHVHDK